LSFCGECSSYWRRRRKVCQEEGMEGGEGSKEEGKKNEEGLVEGGSLVEGHGVLGGSEGEMARREVRHSPTTFLNLLHPKPSPLQPHVVSNL